MAQSFQKMLANQKSKIFIFFSLKHLLGNKMRSWTRGWKTFVIWQAFSCSSHTSRQDKEMLFYDSGANLPIKSQECGDLSWVGFWVFPCAKLDSVQKFLDWHLEYFFLSTNVCCNNIITLEINISQNSDFNQKSTKSKLAQNKTKSKELNPLNILHIFCTKSKSYPGSYVFNKRLFHLTKSFLQTWPFTQARAIT